MSNIVIDRSRLEHVQNFLRQWRRSFMSKEPDFLVIYRETLERTLTEYKLLLDTIEPLTGLYPSMEQARVQAMQSVEMCLEALLEEHYLGCDFCDAPDKCAALGVCVTSDMRRNEGPRLWKK